MIRLMRFLHWVNLDTAIGAVVTSLFIAKYLGSDIPHVASITLLLAVLAIYNFDHLMDARRVSSIARSARHRFYQQNQRFLSIYQLILMLALITIIWYLPAEILRAGLVLALLTGIYFILLFFVFPNKFMLKEIIIASVYAMALFLAPIYSASGITADNWLVFWLQILLMAVANTLIFAWYDHEIDIAEGHTSLARNLGKSIVYRVVVAILIIILSISVFQVWSGAEILQQGIIMLMALVLYFSLLASRPLAKNDRYRIIGDAVFIIPVINLFL